MLEARLSKPAQTLVVGTGDERRRLDLFVAAALAPEWSRSQAGRMIKAGLITVNGAAVRVSCPIRPGDKVEIAAPSPRTPLRSAQVSSGPALEVLFKDPELLAINKPAGIPVHPSPGHPDSTLVDALIAQFPELAAMVEPDGVLRPGIVHRLDKDTSGVMVVARTPFARMALSRQFKDRTVDKIYLAIVRGLVANDHFLVERAVGRHPTERKRMSIHSRKPRTALTQFLVLHRLVVPNPATLLRARPQTGRTHQIRVHLASAGYPCLGDSLYGNASKIGKSNDWVPGRQALHALALTITHPRSAERIEFIAPIPDDMTRFLTAAGIKIGPLKVRQWLDAE